MPAQPSAGPFCQSCSMPLEQAKDFGTDRSGMRVNDYCHFCFVDGEFTSPDISMPGMIDLCVSVMAKQGIMPEAEARALMTDVVPRLKRWRKAPVGA